MSDEANNKVLTLPGDKCQRALQIWDLLKEGVEHLKPLFPNLHPRLASMTLQSMAMEALAQRFSPVMDIELLQVLVSGENDEKKKKVSIIRVLRCEGYGVRVAGCDPWEDYVQQEKQAFAKSNQENDPSIVDVSARPITSFDGANSKALAWADQVFARWQANDLDVATKEASPKRASPRL